MSKIPPIDYETAAKIVVQIDSGETPVSTRDLLSLAEYVASSSSDKRLAKLVLGMMRHMIASNSLIHERLTRAECVTSRYELCR